MMHSHLTVEEVHKIAFLTMKGWSLVGGEWMKEGFERENQEWLHSRCSDWPRRTTPYFSLDDAYDVQSERDV